MKNTRVQKLATRLEAMGLDAAAVLPSAGLFYLTGMSAGLSERPMLFVITTKAEMVAICPSFEAERVRRDSGVSTLFTYTDEEGAAAGFKRLRESIGELKSIAMEYQAARLLEFTLLRDCCGATNLVDLRPILAELRMKKEPAEINKMQQAAALADSVMGALEKSIKLGVTELELVEVAHAHVKKVSGAKMSFISVVGGERSALPHAGTTNRPFQAGDSIVIDLGCYVEGYTSDITRSFVLEQADEEMSRVAQVVLEANKRARDAVRPGVTASYLDKVAREYITSQGYGAYFTHRLGHGLGLEVHEEPYIVDGNEQQLEAGHTFTIEPGVYLPGKGGVRIEDDVCVTATGYVSFTTYPREVKVIKG